MRQPTISSVVHCLYKHKMATIGDNFESLDAVSEAIKKEGLDACNLVFGIDYTTGNLDQGKDTFGGKSLHTLSESGPNPYQQIISILGETLERFDKDGLIPAFIFGDESTKDTAVLSLNQEGDCKGFKEVLAKYNEKTPTITLGGPTNLAPIIEKALDIVNETKEYHILVIITHGQLVDTKATTDAIIKASNSALSIIAVGVGDGPWQVMETFDDGLTERKFDNFQFVDFFNVTKDAQNQQTAFALNALMEIPEQYKAIKSLGYF